MAGYALGSALLTQRATCCVGEKKTVMRHPSQNSSSPSDSTASWITTTSGDVVNVADITYVTETYGGLMIVGTVSGEQHVCPAADVPSAVTMFVFDNDLTVEGMEEIITEDSGAEDSEAKDSEAEEECKCDSEADDSEDSEAEDSEDAQAEEECKCDSEAENSEDGEADDSEDDSDYLLKVYFVAAHVDAVFSQCGAPDEDGDYGHCVVLSSGEERRVFSRHPPVPFAEALGLPPPYAVAVFQCPLLDHHIPQYVASFNPARVTSYSNFYDVTAMGAYVDVCLKSGYFIEGAFVTGPQYAAICAIYNPKNDDKSVDREPPAKRRCLRPRE